MRFCRNVGHSNVDHRGARALASASRRLSRLAAASAAVLALAALAVSPALADHGLGHNGETMTLSKEADIADGETVTVELTSFLPDASITVVTCYNFPAVGPTDCELSNYGQHTTTADADGMATVEYPVSVVEGRCDHENPCYIVAGDGIGPNANYAGVQVTFAMVEEEAPEEAEEEAMVEEEAMEEEEEAAPAPETTAAPAPETTAMAAPAPETTAAPEPEPEPTAAPAPAPSDDGGGSSAGLIVLIAVVAVVVVGGGVVLARRRSA